MTSNSKKNPMRENTPPSQGIAVPVGQFPIQLTPQAVRMGKVALQETQGEDGQWLRVSVRGGGCAGFYYGLNFDDHIDELDMITQADGLKLVVDVFSSCHLRGTRIDYVESLQEGAGFQFHNPTARRTCGCGSSFG